MRELRRYYKELVGYLIQKYFNIDTGTPKKFHHVGMDMVFEIPQESLRLAGKSPFPYLAEVNLIYFKPLNEKFTKTDIVHAVGALYLAATNTFARDKSIALMILTNKKTDKHVDLGLHKLIENKEVPWVYQITAEAPAYLFIADEVPMNDKDSWCFLPFQSASLLETYHYRYPLWREHLRRISEGHSITQEDAAVLFWLKKLHREFYEKEVGMAMDLEEIVRELCPHTLAKAKQEGIDQGFQKGMEQGYTQGLSEGFEQGLQKGIAQGIVEGTAQGVNEGGKQGLEEGILQGMQRSIMCLLEAKFGTIPEEGKKKITRVTAAETLEILLKKAATATSWEEFENQMKVTFWKYRT